MTLNSVILNPLPEDHISCQVPPPLRPGDKVMVMAPSRAVEQAELKQWSSWMQERGYQVLYGASIGVRDHQLAGNDELRSQDLQYALNNPEIRAVFFARGGYGAARILDQIQWQILKAEPKWLCGYSDATAILNHAHATTGLVSIHGPMPFQFSPNEDWEHTLQLMEGLLTPKDPTNTQETDHYLEPFYTFEPHVLSKHDPATLWPMQGKLIGGNLSVLYSLLGSGSLPPSTGCILIVEDLDEYLYHLDRMWLALQRSGYLHNLRGILLGDFTGMRDHAIPFGRDPQEIALERIQFCRTSHQHGIPCITGIPFGHGLKNSPLPLGSSVTLNSNGLSLHGNPNLKTKSNKG